MANTITAGNATNGGTAISSDTSGILELRTGSSPTTALTISTGQVVTVVNPIQGGTITSGTAVASTSGTSIDFTGIPSWVKRITVMLNGVSTNGSSIVQLQLGTSSGITTSGYNSTSGSFTSATPSVITLSTGFSPISGGASSDVRYGVFVFINVSSNIWVGTGQVAVGSYFGFGSGQINLSGTLDRIRITTVNGTDTFDAGSINILYE